MNASSIRPVPYLLGGSIKPSGCDRSASAPPVGARLCALTTGNRISNVPQGR